MLDVFVDAWLAGAGIVDRGDDLRAAGGDAGTTRSFSTSVMAPFSDREGRNLRPLPTTCRARRTDVGDYRARVSETLAARQNLSKVRSSGWSVRSASGGGAIVEAAGW